MDLESLAISSTMGIMVPLALLTYWNINAYHQTRKVLESGKHPVVHRFEWETMKELSAAHMTLYIATSPGRELAFKHYEE